MTMKRFSLYIGELAIQSASLGGYKVRTNILDDYSQLFTPTVIDLLQKLKTFDKCTYFHSLQTTSYYIDFCQYHSFNDFLTPDILHSVLFHDIGKLLIPLSIIRKKGTLSSYEWSVLKKHPRYSLNYLSQYPEIKIDPFLILYHHRNIDGSGYPLTQIKLWTFRTKPRFCVS